MSKEKDMSKLFWCAKVLGDRVEFREPMQLTFKSEADRLLYLIAWGE